MFTSACLVPLAGGKRAWKSKQDGWGPKKRPKKKDESAVVPQTLAAPESVEKWLQVLHKYRDLPDSDWPLVTFRRTSAPGKTFIVDGPKSPHKVAALQGNFRLLDALVQHGLYGGAVQGDLDGYAMMFQSVVEASRFGIDFEDSLTYQSDTDDFFERLYSFALSYKTTLRKRIGQVGNDSTFAMAQRAAMIRAMVSEEAQAFLIIQHHASLLKLFYRDDYGRWSSNAVCMALRRGCPCILGLVVPSAPFDHMMTALEDQTYHTDTYHFIFGRLIDLCVDVGDPRLRVQEIMIALVRHADVPAVAVFVAKTKSSVHGDRIYTDRILPHAVHSDEMLQCLLSNVDWGKDGLNAAMECAINGRRLNAVRLLLKVPTVTGTDWYCSDTIGSLLWSSSLNDTAIVKALCDAATDGLVAIVNVFFWDLHDRPDDTDAAWEILHVLVKHANFNPDQRGSIVFLHNPHALRREYSMLAVMIGFQIDISHYVEMFGLPQNGFCTNEDWHTVRRANQFVQIPHRNLSLLEFAAIKNNNWVTLMHLSLTKLICGKGAADGPPRPPRVSPYRDIVNSMIMMIRLGYEGEIKQFISHSLPVAILQTADPRHNPQNTSSILFELITSLQQKPGTNLIPDPLHLVPALAAIGANFAPGEMSGKIIDYFRTAYLGQPNIVRKLIGVFGDEQNNPNFVLFSSSKRSVGRIPVKWYMSMQGQFESEWITIHEANRFEYTSGTITKMYGTAYGSAAEYETMTELSDRWRDNVHFEFGKEWCVPNAEMKAVQTVRMPSGQALAWGHDDTILAAVVSWMLMFLEGHAFGVQLSPIFFWSFMFGLARDQAATPEELLELEDPVLYRQLTELSDQTSFNLYYYGEENPSEEDSDDELLEYSPKLVSEMIKGIVDDRLAQLSPALFDISRTYWDGTLLVHLMNQNKMSFAKLHHRCCVAQVTVEMLLKHVTVGTDNTADDNPLWKLDTETPVNFSKDFHLSVARFIAFIKSLTPDEMKQFTVFWTGVSTPAIEGVQSSPGYGQSTRGLRLVFTNKSNQGITVSACFNHMQISSAWIDFLGSQEAFDAAMKDAVATVEMQDPGENT